MTIMDDMKREDFNGNKKNDDEKETKKDDGNERKIKEVIRTER